MNTRRRAFARSARARQAPEKPRRSRPASGSPARWHTWRPPSTAARVRYLTLTAAGSTVALGALYTVAVRTAVGQRTDNAALAGRPPRPAVLDAANQLLDTISILSLVVGIIVLVVLALARRRPRLALGVPMAVLGANVTTQLLKHAILSRPALVPADGLGTGPSFPSGHATVAMSLALAFPLVVVPRWRAAAGVLAVVYATAIGTATLTAGWHRPSDVLGAYLVATVWMTALAAWLIGWRGTGIARGGRARWQAPFVPIGTKLATIATLIVLAGTTGAIAVVIATTRPVELVEFSGDYLVAVALIAGTGLVLLAALLAGLRGARLDAPDTNA